jgi:hypothetical protein
MLIRDRWGYGAYRGEVEALYQRRSLHGLLEFGELEGCHDDLAEIEQARGGERGLDHDCT